MPVMTGDDFSLHHEDCDDFDDGMPTGSFPNVVSSIDDLDCECWDRFDSLSEAE